MALVVDDRPMCSEARHVRWAEKDDVVHYHRIRKAAGKLRAEPGFSPPPTENLGRGEPVEFSRLPRAVV